MKPTLSTPKKYTLIRWPGGLHEGKCSIGGGCFSLKFIRNHHFIHMGISQISYQSFGICIFVKRNVVISRWMKSMKHVQPSLPQVFEVKHSNDILAWLEDNDFTDYSCHQNIILVKLFYMIPFYLKFMWGILKAGGTSFQYYMMGI